METNHILKADLLDIIFEGKNKQYGAYELRRTYDRRLMRALLLTGAIAVLVFAATFFARAFKGKSNEQLTVHDTELRTIQPETLPPPPLPPPPVVTPPPPLNQVRFTPPVIVEDDQVTPDERIEEIQDDQAISTQTVLSENTNGVVAPPVEEQGTQVVQAPVVKPNEEDLVFTSVQIQADFPGGEAAWRRYLEKNLNPNIPVDNGAPEGTYTVTVQFVVSKTGAISDVKALSNHGYGMEEEAVKIIQRGPNWKPGVQNGHNVNSLRMQPITFSIQEQ
jgi:periplasmic protein TonB